ncbi:RraA family protein [Lachnospiraceae bacterium 54-53]
MANAGCRIRKNIDRPSAELVEAFRDIPVANIDDCMNRIAAVDSGLKPMNRARLLGTAFTVKAPAGDNLMFHKALDMAQPGDVLVIAAFASQSRSLCGEIMTRYAMSKGLAGFVVDGCIRDSIEIGEITDFPVYARGVTPNGPYKNGPGEINFPVSCGNQVISPGDILVGDGDGLLVIKKEEAAELAKRAKKVSEAETGQFASIAAGNGLNRSWIDEKLTEIGVEYID